MFSSKNLRMLVALVALGLLLTAPCLAQETPGETKKPAQETPQPPKAPPEKTPTLTVTATVCTAIEDREPVGAGDTFPATVGKLYCHTLVEGAQEPTTVTHVWYYGEKKMAEVSLTVGSARWRTWSSKRIMKSWTGEWRVEILDEEGKLLTTISFQIQ